MSSGPEISHLVSLDDAFQGTAGPLALHHRESDGLVVLCASGSGGSEGVRCWNARNGELLAEFVDSDLSVNALCLTRSVRDGIIAAAATDQGLVRWNALDGARLATHGADRREEIWAAASWCGTDGSSSFFASGGESGVVSFWDSATGLPCAEPVEAINSVKSLALTEITGGTVVAVAGCDGGFVHRWNARTGEALGPVIEGHRELVNAITPVRLPTGSTVIACSDGDGAVSVWDLGSGVPCAGPLATGSYVPQMATLSSTDPALLVTAGDDEVVRFWDLESATLLDESLVGVSVAAVRLENGTALVATGTFDGAVRVFGVRVPTPAARLRSASRCRSL